LGAPNKNFIGRFLDAKRIDLATRGTVSINGNSSCSLELGFLNNSRLCHTCAKGNRRQGRGECAKCPKSEGENVGLIILGVVVVMGILTFIVNSSFESAGKQEISESVQKIFLNYLQVATLARTFPLRWPPAIEGLFAFQGAISTLGNFFHLICLLFLSY
jgi:hypothetical protein